MKDSTEDKKFSPKKLIINYNKEYINKFEENKKEFLTRLKSDNLSKADKQKISNYCLKHGYKKDDIVKELKKSLYLIDFFVPEPSRQSFHENLMYQNLYEVFNDVGFIEINKLNNKALYINNKGKAVSKDKLGKADKKIKSIDFETTYTFKGETLLFLMSAKYTNEDGGAQDNQRNDMINSLENASKITDKNIVFLGITEGDYYKKIRKNNKKSYLESLKKDYNKKNINVDDLYDTSKRIIEIIKDWLIENFEDNKEREEELIKLNKMLSTY